ncbi:MAG: hypothetical protein NXI18_00180 [Alphaproteobacteria bacterium]|nr:hypothetical protein [Alphaproteobacteria bacterium]
MRQIFVETNAFLRGLDLELVLHDGFEALEPLNMDRGGQPVFSGFTPQNSPDGFWIEARLHGRPIATYGAYPMVLSDTLTSHIELEGWYPSSSDRWRVAGSARDLTDRIRDMAVFSGGIVVTPDMRKTETSKMLVWMLPMVGRSLGIERWDAPHFVFMVKPNIPGLGVRFRPERLEPEVEWYRSGQPFGLPRLFGYASKEFARRQADDFMRSL